LPVLKTYLRVFLVLLIGFGARAQGLGADESLGEKIKKIFTTPTPTPTRKHRKHSAAKKSPTPSPTPSPKKKKPSPTPEPSESPKAKSKAKKKKPSPTPTPAETPSPSATPEETPSPSPTSTASPSETPTPSVSSREKKGAPNATISPNELSGYDDYPAPVRKIIDTALELTTRNLTYSYGSADPASGGMDCSGFVYYVLQQNDVKEVPRDSSQQYVWVRKSGNFRAVISRNADSFELDALKPGDLLFWTGTYSIDRDPPITHSMIYIGKEKGTDRRIMAGASDGRSFDGKQRFGVSIFDFKLSKPKADKDTKLSPLFVGYGRIPGLGEN
jgi:cell wall-associated NlpC family hydrolase